jgi:hypothetical protein
MQSKNSLIQVCLTHVDVFQQSFQTRNKLLNKAFHPVPTVQKYRDLGTGQRRVVNFMRQPFCHQENNIQ